MQPRVRQTFNVPPAGQADDWGLTPDRPDPPCADTELGWTTSEDGQWEAAPITPTAFAMSIAVAVYGILRWVVCTTGIHRRRVR